MVGTEQRMFLMFMEALEKRGSSHALKLYNFQKGIPLMMDSYVTPLHVIYCIWKLYMTFANELKTDHCVKPVIVNLCYAHMIHQLL